jgi:hypothetical protein
MPKACDNKEGEGGQHDGTPVYAPSVSSRRAGADRVRVWSGRSGVPDGTAHHAPDHGQAAGLEQRTMRQHGSRQPGKPARSLATLWEQKGGKHPTSSRARPEAAGDRGDQSVIDAMSMLPVSTALSTEPRYHGSRFMTRGTLVPSVVTGPSHICAGMPHEAHPGLQEGK